MNVVIVSGIWPPDVGGPASHAPELADFLHGRGHDVKVATTAMYPSQSLSVRSPRSRAVGDAAAGAFGVSVMSLAIFTWAYRTGRSLEKE